MFGGIRDDQLIPVTAGDTIRFSPTVRVEEQFLSGDIELEAWMTNAKVALRRITTPYARISAVLLRSVAFPMKTTKMTNPMKTTRPVIRPNDYNG
ncbi:hypothetical protein D8S78_16745 [Natrialba swarupiae]|nr:hypothetical protein [Natrialba swarupiae]